MKTIKALDFSDQMIYLNRKLSIGFECLLLTALGDEIAHKGNVWIARGDTICLAIFEVLKTIRCMSCLVSVDSIYDNILPER